MGNVKSNDEQTMSAEDQKHMETEEAASERTDMRDLISEIICPFTFKVTLDLAEKKVSAVNYDTTFVGSVNLGDARGSWKIAPQLQLTDEGKKLRHDEGYKALTEEHIEKNGQGAKQARPYSLKVYQELEKLVESGRISWYQMNEENPDQGRFLRLAGDKWEPTDALVFYFTHEQGQNAAQRYVKLVLEGQVRANKRSWENRYAQMTGTSYEELEKKYPDTYATRTKSTSSKETIAAENVKATAADIFDDEEMVEGVTEPTDEQMFGTPESEEDPSDEDIEQAATAEGVAAATALADPLEEASTKDAIREEMGNDDRVMTKLRLTNYNTPERVSEDTFIKRMDNEDIQYYEVELPGLELPLWIPGDTALEIEGTTYNFVTENSDDEE